MNSVIKDKKGFTIIELLVVLGILGVLMVLAVSALGNARAKSRDTKRIADIRQIQNALELYFNDVNSYPVADTAITLGDAVHKTLSSVNNFAAATAGTVYMGQVPGNLGPGGANYIYASATGATYTITFALEGQSGSLGSGARTATPDGLK